MRFLTVAIVALVVLAGPVRAQLPDGLERLLLPILIPQIRGAFDTSFRTELSVWNSHSDQPLSVYGLQLSCFPGKGCPGPDPATGALIIPARSWQISPSAVVMSGNPGRFLYVPRGSGDSFAADLRVSPVYHRAIAFSYFGTEMPIVREREFRRGAIAFIGLPDHNLVRLALRIYSVEPVSVTVTATADFAEKRAILPLRPGADVFDPAYAIYTDFPQVPFMPIPTHSLRVTVEPNDDVPIWAFLTITDNFTQEVSTMTPH